MKVLIIGGTKQEADADVRAYYQKYIDFFKKSADQVSQGTVVESCMMEDLLISVGDGTFSIYDTHNNHDLSDYGAFFLRGDRFRSYMDVIATINEFAFINGIKIINEYSNVRDSSKLLQAVHFQKLDIPVARTLYVNKALMNHQDKLGWEFPSVMKATHGSHGDDNYIVHSMDDVRRYQQEQPEKQFVLQRFVPNNGDYRILVIGDEVLVIGRTAVGDSHLNNTSKGGEAVLVDINEIPEKVISDARKIMDYLGMTIAGVDALADKNTNEYSFLEVNAQPQLMSGAFIEEKELLMGKLLDKLSH